MLDYCTVLLENHQSELKSVIVKHGLSYLLNVDGKKILFDCGPDASFLYNAKLLNVDLSNVDYIVLSHSHYDHSAGYQFFLENKYCKNLVIGKDFFKPKYALKDECFTYLGCGFDRSFVEEKNINITYVDKCVTLTNNLYAFSSFKKRHDFEVVPSRFVKGELDNFEKDYFEDEVVLVKEYEDSLTAIVGCAHIGILSICEEISEYFGKEVTKVLGGIHLNSNTKEYVDKVIESLISSGVKHAAFCHCSGDYVINKCISDERLEYSEIATGNTIRI